MKKSFIDSVVNFGKNAAFLAKTKGTAVANHVAQNGVKGTGAGLWDSFEKTADDFISQPRVQRIIDSGASLVKVNPDKGELAFTKKGLAVGFGLVAVGGAYQGVSAQNKIDMGTTDGSVYRATPSYRSYLQAPGGADGSLVFALDRNKRGGYL